MKVLLAYTPKGGSGKSTVAREIAVAASRDRVVVMADLDPQGSTRGWYGRREAGTPRLVGLDPAAPDDTLEALHEHGVDLLVVDTPPGTPSWMPALLARADAVLVPVRPTADDLLAAAPIAEALASRTWCWCLTQAPVRSRFNEQAIRQLAGLGLVAPATLHFRQDYPAAAITGQAAVELGGKGEAEVMELLRYINASMLGEGR